MFATLGSVLLTLASIAAILLGWLFHDNYRCCLPFKKQKKWLRRSRHMVAVSAAFVTVALVAQPAAAGITLGICVVLPIALLTLLDA